MVTNIHEARITLLWWPTDEQLHADAAAARPGHRREPVRSGQRFTEYGVQVIAC